MYKTIGFFGDSFCSVVESENNPDRWKFEDETYLKKIRDYFNLEVVNVGQVGSSIWDLLLLQLNPLIESKKVPDICIFVWTSTGRIFHRNYRDLNSGSVFSNDTNADEAVIEAAKQYFKHFYDPEKESIEYVSLLQYIDNNILPNLETKKIIHLWSFGNVKDWKKIKTQDITYPYTWKNGVEIRPSLITVSLKNYDTTMIEDRRPNHLDGDKNDIVFNWIRDAIDGKS